MKTQYSLMIEIANLILEKVKQYISEHNSVDEDTCVWVDWDAREVFIGSEKEDHKGDKIPIVDFIFVDANALLPDYDQIDTYAATEWRSHKG
jgi:hypothetical protein